MTLIDDIKRDREAGTPGDWSAPEKYLSEVEAESGDTIASCWHEHAVGQKITLNGVLSCSLQESASNARRIARVPAMEEALLEKVEDLQEASTRITEQAAEIERLREALEPSGETKCAYMSEFSFTREVFDEDGDEVTEELVVPWSTVKDIMAAISELAAQGEIK